MKGKLEFELPEEREDFEDAQKGTRYKIQVEEIWEKIFRPRHKHGYQDEKINQLIEDNTDVNLVLDYFEKLYFEVLND